MSVNFYFGHICSGRCRIFQRGVGGGGGGEGANVEVCPSPEKNLMNLVL